MCGRGVSCHGATLVSVNLVVEGVTQRRTRPNQQSLQVHASFFVLGDAFFVLSSLMLSHFSFFLFL